MDLQAAADMYNAVAVAADVAAAAVAVAVVACWQFAQLLNFL